MLVLLLELLLALPLEEYPVLHRVLVMVFPLVSALIFLPVLEEAQMAFLLAVLFLLWVELFPLLVVLVPLLVGLFLLSGI